MDIRIVQEAKDTAQVWNADELRDLITALNLIHAGMTHPSVKKLDTTIHVHSVDELTKLGKPRDPEPPSAEPNF